MKTAKQKGEDLEYFSALLDGVLEILDSIIASSSEDSNLAFVARDVVRRVKDCIDDL